MSNEIPFQIEHLINSLLNKNESIHIRGNYRQRVVAIQEALDKALRKYDNDAYMSNAGKKKRV